MTRLQSSDIANIAAQLAAYDQELLIKTGHNLRQIACHAVQLKEEDALGAMSEINAAVVPISWGQGVIEGFSRATAGILAHLGFSVLVTGRSDIAGLTEAYEAQADVVFLSDDNDFVALNTETRQYVHNSDATGKGFAAALALMAAGLDDKEVLVLGCGPVGQSAISALLTHGAMVAAYDIDSEKCRMIKNNLTGADLDRITIESNFGAAMARHALIVDATNAAGIIGAGDITRQTIVAAPGLPLGLSQAAREKISDRLLHDPLQIGVATMGMEVVRQVFQR